MYGLNFFTTASSLNRRSSRILDVFTETQNSLKQLIDEKLAYSSKLELKIDKLQQEKDLVQSSITQDTKVIQKIDDFLK